MIQENTSLKSYNTFGIEAKARFFYQVTSIADLKAILTQTPWQSMPKLIIGEGSNVLLTQNFPGLVLRIQIKGITKIAEDEDHVWVQAGAGENWHNFVLYCLSQQYAGVENLSLIPGTVGAAPMQNIGAYGIELTQVFDHLTAVHLKTGNEQVFRHQDCHFGYRDSIFKNQFKNEYVIVNVTFRLNKKAQFNLEYHALQQALSEIKSEKINIKLISDIVIKIRQTKLPDPKVIGNAGSFFKNPIVSSETFKMIQAKHPEIPYFSANNGYYKIPAAWLIEQCHWKGYRSEDVGVHQHHALVLVNYGNGSGQAIQKLAKDIQNSVKEKFAVEILPEVNII